MKLGLISKYKVERETDLGYTISDEDGEYFLHHNECNHQSFADGEVITAFLYTDKLKRVAATCFMPYITLEKGALCEVVNKTEAGCYVKIGISRDILLSSDDLPKEQMPEIGDKVACRLRIKGNSLYIRLLNKQEILSLNDGTKLNVDDKVLCRCYRITNDGINVIDEHFNIIFIYKKYVNKSYRVGEEVMVRITKVNEEDYYGSCIDQKEISILKDKEVIIDYLEKHFGVIPFSENSDSDVIFRVFKMSKAAFKRALGALYKERKITIEDERIILNDYLK